MSCGISTSARRLHINLLKHPQLFYIVIHSIWLRGGHSLLSISFEQWLSDLECADACPGDSYPGAICPSKDKCPGSKFVWRPFDQVRTTIRVDICQGRKLIGVLHYARLGLGAGEEEVKGPYPGPSPNNALSWLHARLAIKSTERGRFENTIM